MPSPDLSDYVTVAQRIAQFRDRHPDGVMDVWCAICGHLWDALDPAVRFVYGDGRWECADEVQCFARRAIRAALDSASEPLRAVQP